MKKHAAQLLALTLTLAAALSLRAAAPVRPLEIYWIDMEGGAGTLIVTPAGESIIVDTGNPSSPNQTDTSAARIHKAAVAAGVSKIDYLILTHFHMDHFGGAADLAKLMPIGQVLDNGIPDHDSDGVASHDAQFAKDITPYRTFKADSRAVMQVGQLIALKQSDGAAPLTFQCVGARKQVFPLGGAGITNGINPDATQHAVDTTDNANSIIMLLKFGPFKFFLGGDLTWNMEGKLVCPVNYIGTVDLYQVDHHGLNLSNNPLLVRALNPTVAVMSNGSRKGANAETLATLRSVSSVQTMWQIHRNTLGDTNVNTDTNYIANIPVACEGNYIKCSVDPSGKSYTVSIPATGVSKTYATVLNRPQ
jgi:beta-lactamase superfamily II metal-dependent hydrolase